MMVKILRSKGRWGEDLYIQKLTTSHPIIWTLDTVSRLRLVMRAQLVAAAFLVGSGLDEEKPPSASISPCSSQDGSQQRKQ